MKRSIEREGDRAGDRSIDLIRSLLLRSFAMGNISGGRWSNLISIVGAYCYWPRRRWLLSCRNNGGPRNWSTPRETLCVAIIKFKDLNGDLAADLRSPIIVCVVAINSFIAATAAKII